jgi:hypothetical protein
VYARIVLLIFLFAAFSQSQASPDNLVSPEFHPDRRPAPLGMLYLKSEGHFRAPIAHLREATRRQSGQRRPRHRSAYN